MDVQVVHITAPDMLSPKPWSLGSLNRYRHHNTWAMDEARGACAVSNELWFGEQYLLHIYSLHLDILHIISGFREVTMLHVFRVLLAESILFILCVWHGIMALLIIQICIKWACRFDVLFRKWQSKAVYSFLPRTLTATKQIIAMLDKQWLFRWK